MGTYKIRENSKEGIVKKNIIRQLPLIVIAMIVGMAIAFYQIGDMEIIKIIIIPSLAIAGGAIFLGMRFGTRIFKDNYVNQTIKIENEVLSIISDNNMSQDIKFSDIESIEKYKNNSVVVKLKNKNSTILNNDIENFETINQRLSPSSEWHLELPP